MTASSSVGIAEITVADAARDTAAQLIGRLRADFGDAENPEFLRRAPGMQHLLPDEVCDRLLDMRYGESIAALVVRGGPVAYTGPTPRRWQERESAATVFHDFWLALVLSQLGDPMAWANHQNGRLFSDILPHADEEEQQTGHSSAQELIFHVEEADHDIRANAFGLLCLRNPGAVPTTLATMASVALHSEAVEVLFEPRFLIGGTDSSRLRPVLFGSPAAPYIRLDPPYTRAVPGDEEAAHALADLIGRLEYRLVDVRLEPGDLLVVDNFRAVHGRRSFTARYDGTDRWLRRLSVMADLRAVRAQRDGVDGRVVIPAGT